MENNGNKKDVQVTVFWNSQDSEEEELAIIKNLLLQEFKELELELGKSSDQEEDMTHLDVEEAQFAGFLIAGKLGEIIISTIVGKGIEYVSGKIWNKFKEGRSQHKEEHPDGEDEEDEEIFISGHFDLLITKIDLIRNFKFESAGEFYEKLKEIDRVINNYRARTS